MTAEQIVFLIGVIGVILIIVFINWPLSEHDKFLMDQQRKINSLESQYAQHLGQLDEVSQKNFELRERLALYRKLNGVKLILEAQKKYDFFEKKFVAQIEECLRYYEEVEKKYELYGDYTEQYKGVCEVLADNISILARHKFADLFSPDEEDSRNRFFLGSFSLENIKVRKDFLIDFREMCLADGSFLEFYNKDNELLKDYIEINPMESFLENLAKRYPHSTNFSWHEGYNRMVTPQSNISYQL